MVSGTGGAKKPGLSLTVSQVYHIIMEMT